MNVRVHIAVGMVAWQEMRVLSRSRPRLISIQAVVVRYRWIGGDIKRGNLLSSRRAEVAISWYNRM